MIEVQHLHVTLQKKKILTDINFSISQGRVMMILGENGSGKTTLIRCLLSQLPYEGSITMDHKPIASLNERKRSEIFSYVAQGNVSDQEMLVEDCIVAGLTRKLSLFSVPRNKEYEQVDRMLERFDLQAIKGKRLHEISGGEQQMCHVAKAFLQDAKVMVMDEPCTYLDYRHQHHFLQQVQTLCQKDHSVLLSIHDPNLALQYADEILMLHEGALIAHLKKEQHDMKKECLKYYNLCYGNRFAFSKEEEQFLVWKGE